MRRFRVLGAVLGCIGCVLVSAPAGLAAPVSNGWGPLGIPYINGVVCSTAHRSTALVSWPSQRTGPAYAVGPVLGPPQGTTGTFANPAVAANQVTPLPSTNDNAALAYLISVHGSSADPATVGNVAAIVSGRRAPNPVADECLAAHAGGLDATAADAMWSEAQQLAGPYRVSLNGGSAKLILGSQVSITAQVLSAAGAAVPGFAVTFSTAEPGASLQPTTATSDSQGVARTQLGLAPGSTGTSVRVEAAVTAPIRLTQLSVPGAVALVVPDSAEEFRAELAVAVDTTADPTLAASAEPNLLLPGGDVHTGLSVSGMRGHNGTASAQLVGPLPFEANVGCSRYRDADWQALATRTGTGTATFGVVGDGSYAGANTRVVAAGCYRVAGQIATTNARPNVTRKLASGAVVTVAPVGVTQAPAGHGLAVPGPLTTTVRVSGTTAASLTQFGGQLLGPRLAANGFCPASGWGGVPATAGLTATAAPDGGSVAFTSPVRQHGDCYAFRLHGLVTLPRIGSIAIAIAPTQAQDSTLILRPVATVTALSSSALQAGGRLRATVNVTGTLTQPALLRIELRHLADSWRGCFGRDWQGASIVRQHTADPLRITHGDGTYNVATPVVPTDGCWAPVPVLTMQADPAITVRGLPTPGTMTAFTSTRPNHVSALPENGSDDPLARLRLLFAIVLMSALLAVALLGTWFWAHRMVAFARSEPAEQFRL